ncbi:MAG: phenylalanine--tRNA ligase subunit beta [Pseudomonadota bacterium]|nr:phenylalanine--tRNA ligase subunit beta [Pseudomonadota bacterium]
MKFTLAWLKQHLDTEAPLQAICDRLTALGLEVENVDDPGKTLAPFIIAHVLSAEKHPQADRLKVARVDTGKERLQVVCGAPNCRAGIKAVLARPGDVMPDSGEALKKGVIRGVESQGMLCAADELRLGDEHAGIIELPDDAPVGESYARYAGYDDPVIEINLTPNRPDCAGVRGIARDLAAAGMGKFKPLDQSVVKGSGPSSIKVKRDFPSDAEDACPLFAGRLVRNIKNGPSPAWLQQRLRAVGLRPISALVDITNYLTFDLARPLHVFDAKKLAGHLVLRLAKDGESFLGLNGKNYTLREGMTVIADESGVVSLAGIMGGSSSACDEQTTDVFIESAYFSAARTARAGRTLQVSSDARYRFERGVDPMFTIPGIEIATRLLLDLCATSETLVSDLEVAGATPDRKNIVTLDPSKCRTHAGVDVPEQEQARILEALGFGVKMNSAKLVVEAPSWRPDIESPADLVEEILRVKGYEHIPATHLTHLDPVTVSAIDSQDARASACRRALASRGLLETVTWAFMSSVIAEPFWPKDLSLRLVNPISSDLDMMRPTVVANLVQAAQRNAARGFADVGLFEIGPIYKSALPEGQETIATTLRAGATPRHWAEASRAVDVFDAKADALTALAAAGAPVGSLQITPEGPAWYHPGRCGSLRLGPVVLAVFGELHPAVLAACDAKGPMVASEVFIAAIPQSRGAAARPLLKLEALQPVTRDFAFLVDRTVTAAKLIKAVKDADKGLIRDVAVFDVYEGTNIEADKKSVAFTVTLQPSDKSLTEGELEAVSAKITDAMAKTAGATLRK